jgi:glycosyltransferase 2 family protein
MKRQTLFIIGRFALSLILLAAILVSINLPDLIERLTKINVLYFIAGLGIYLCSIAAWAFRWHLFLRDTITDVRYTDTLTTLLAGLFTSLFLPTMVGADIGRAYELSRRSHQTVDVVSTVMFDRLIGFVAVLLTAVVAIILLGSQYISNDLLYTILFILGGMVIAFGLFFNPRFIRRFSWALNLPLINRYQAATRQLYQALYRLYQKPMLSLLALITSMGVVLLEIIAVVVLGYAIGVTVDPIYFFIFVPIIWNILIIPISINGLGVRETAFVFFFTQVGMVAGEAVLLSLLYYFYTVITGLIGGILIAASSLNLLLARRE